jgi:hypothetical protein
MSEHNSQCTTSAVSMPTNRTLTSKILGNCLRPEPLTIDDSEAGSADFPRDNGGVLDLNDLIQPGREMELGGDSTGVLNAFVRHACARTLELCKSQTRIKQSTGKANRGNTLTS